LIYSMLFAVLLSQRDDIPNVGPAAYNFEMGFFLDPSKVLKRSNQWALKDSVADAFNIDKSVAFEVVFLDSLDKKFDALHWDIRFRSTMDVKGYEITYKKRYPIAVSLGTPPANISSVVAQAQQDGFDSEATNYAAQIDVLWSKWTLSFSLNKFGKEVGEADGKVPTDDDMRKFSTELLPGKLVNAVPDAAAIVKNCHVYGPVEGLRFFGTFMELEIELEIWKVLNADKTGYEYLVDLSFKNGPLQDSNSIHEALRAYLIGMDWILPQDILKTNIILSRY